MNDLKPQDNDRPAKPAGLFRYRLLIFLAAAAAVSLALALYLTRGPQTEQAVRTGALPPTAGAATGVSPSPVAPISPLSPVSPVQATPIPKRVVQATVQSTAERGLQLYQSGNYTEALKVFNTVAEMQTDDPLVYDTRGSIYTALNDYEHALSDYNRAIQLNPDMAQAYYNRGRVYSLLKRYDEAVADFQMATKLDGRSFGYRANGNIGLIYYQQGQYDKALTAFDASIASADVKADAFYLRGETYIALAKYELAVTDYESAVGRYPQYSSAYQGLGYAYYKLTQYDKAVEALNQALSISPADAVAHLYLALVYVATDKLDSSTAEVSSAAATFSALPPEDQKSIYSRVAADLKTWGQQHPGQAKEVDSIIARLPQPQ